MKETTACEYMRTQKSKSIRFCFIIYVVIISNLSLLIYGRYISSYIYNEYHSKHKSDRALITAEAKITDGSICVINKKVVFGKNHFAYHLILELRMVGLLFQRSLST